MAERSGGSYRVKATRAAQEPDHQVTRATGMYAQMGDPAAQAVMAKGSSAAVRNCTCGGGGSCNCGS